MDEEERLAKLREWLEGYIPFTILKEFRSIEDFNLSIKKNRDEGNCLWNELYPFLKNFGPYLPKDLMEDVKKRQRAYKIAKSGD
jgi:hypothetical protein